MDFAYCSGVSIVDFEQASVGWVTVYDTLKLDYSKFMTLLWILEQKLLFINYYHKSKFYRYLNSLSARRHAEGTHK